MFQLLLYFTIIIADLVSSQRCLRNQKCVPLNDCPTTRRSGTTLVSCRNGYGFCCLKKTPSRQLRLPELPSSDLILTHENFLRQHENYHLLPEPGKCGTRGPQEINNKIEDGDEVAKGEYPWMAYLLARENEYTSSHCSGTIINKRHVLTAAHCVVGFEPKSMTVYAGLETLNCTVNNSCTQGVQTMKVSKLIPHHRYVEKNGSIYQINDVALVRLEKELEFNAFVWPVCLPIEEKQRSGLRNKALTLLGWGFDDKFHRPDNVMKDLLTAGKTKALQKISVNFVDPVNCKKDWNTPLLELINSQICILGNQKSRPTKGDSGGPLLTLDQKSMRCYVVAITSFGHKSRRDLPVVMVRVGKYIEWILNNLEQ